MRRKNLTIQTKHKVSKHMLHALLKNKAIKNPKIYREALRTGQVKNPGLFLQAVLEGDYSTAMARANANQFYALETLPHSKLKTTSGGFIYVINYKNL